ncbi:phosphoenolpyruvate--protein phosphotransferase [Nitrospirillum sp. BR 11164]|uniref:phosphoenolpyruvate--protein phosphotransferase n=1 Tax=Nitrospirillum sp. BR 11164 TaxID=3104324 RepID=UPI002AFFE90F|nr:phosphoenolpyruvate--protein phosphotransferase [Nitrospirillum sp. BR 11164]MEA1648050.1 phosphoenolpyruvate--protein phosphotransferase [Nitrospirillum sp. BR 11164]
MPFAVESDLLPRELIRLGARPAGKRDAIGEAAQMLVAAGCVDPAYEQSMVRREEVANTFLGQGVAIPHGLGEDRHLVRRNGLAILQVPDGVEWNAGQRARLVVAIAAQSDAHITILRRLTRLIQDGDRLDRLLVTTDAGEIAAALGHETPPAGRADEGGAGAPVGDLGPGFDWTVDYPSGQHARPAAHWVDTARRFAAQVRVRHGDQPADAKNLIALLQLGLRAGDTVVVSAAGTDAAGALGAMRQAMSGLSAQEKMDAALAASRARQTPRTGWTPPAPLTAIGGVPAAPGLAIGPLHVLKAADPMVPDNPVALAEGGSLLQEALSRTRQQLKALADDTARRLGAADAGIFKAQAELLNDTDLITLACQLMVDGHGVAWAWNQTVDRMAGRLAALGNPVLAARAADLRDVGRRVLGHIDPSLRANSLLDLPDTPCVLVAPDLSPSDTAGLDPARVVGLATASGGPTSHTAILARTLGLPAVVGGGGALLELADGTSAILDGQSGQLYLEPSDADLESARQWLAVKAEARAREAEARALSARTRDGHTVSIGANINLPDQAAFALSQGAEGVGLMRTEFLFLERGETPSEDEQFEIYRAMAEALGNRPLIVRALDIGGDKQVAHLNLPHEENPFLGVRGARLLLRRPDLLEPQLRALYRAARAGASLSIMFPMITTAAEIIALRAVSERIQAEVEAPAVPLGIMIEVPAAALQAESLARHADFFSVGTNDLTQYTLAIDRQNPRLAAEADSLHPAVLRLIQATVAGAAKQDRWVGVCGGIAGDPFGAALLTGLGVQELSMTPREVSAVKARLRDSELTALRALAARALACEAAEDVRALEGGMA